MMAFYVNYFPKPRFLCLGLCRYKPYSKYKSWKVCKREGRIVDMSLVCPAAASIPPPDRPGRSDCLVGPDHCSDCLLRHLIVNGETGKLIKSPFQKSPFTNCC